MTEWFEGRSTDEQRMERCYWRRVGFIVFIAILAGLILLPLNVHSEPLFVAKDADAVITLHSDACQLTEVTNLPHKATWVEKDKTYEGCWAHKGGIVIFYFSDKTVGIAPAQVFERVVGV